MGASAFGWRAACLRRGGNPPAPAFPWRVKRERGSSGSLLPAGQSLHGIELSYTWVKMALQGAGLVSQQRRRGKHFFRAQPASHDPVAALQYARLCAPGGRIWRGMAGSLKWMKPKAMTVCTTAASGGRARGGYR
jgi:hypothetical protein